MHKYNNLFFSVLILLVSCQKVKVPDNIIQPDRMKNLLVDVHIVDGSMYSVMQMPDSLYKYGTAKYLTVFKRHHTDSAQFKKSMQFYSMNPGILETIYEKVTADIKGKSDSLNKINQKQIEKDNKRRADSLKKLPKQPQPAQPPAVTPQVSQKHLPHKLVPLKPRKGDAVPAK